MRKLLIGLVALILLAVLAVALSIDRLAGAAIERGASAALGVDTRVGFVRLSPSTANSKVSSLRVANPPGFQGEHFLSFDRFELKADLGHAARAGGRRAALPARGHRRLAGAPGQADQHRRHLRQPEALRVRARPERRAEAEGEGTRAALPRGGAGDPRRARARRVDLARLAPERARRPDRRHRAGASGRRARPHAGRALEPGGEGGARLGAAAAASCRSRWRTTSPAGCAGWRACRSR